MVSRADTLTPGRIGSGRVSQPSGRVRTRSLLRLEAMLVFTSGILRRGRSKTSSTSIAELSLWAEAFVGSGLALVRRRHSGRIQSKKHTRSVGGLLADSALWLTAAAGAFAIVITATAAIWGVRPIVVRSGSMEPSISTGAVLIGRPVDSSSLHAGDVISVIRPDHIRVTHRIVEIKQISESEAEVVLKGDANEKPDPLPLRIERPYKVVGSVSKGAWIARYSATPVGGFLLGLTLACGVLIPKRKTRTG